MQSNPEYLPPKVKEEETHFADASPALKKEENNFSESSSLNHLESTIDEPWNASPVEDDEDDEVQILEPDDDHYLDNVQNQLVVYDPEANGVSHVDSLSHPNDYHRPSSSLPILRPHDTVAPPKTLPAVGAFTVQCADCFKWRLIPTKEKYEEIRESILQQPFVCARAREWNPDVTCDDDPDIEPDKKRLWAIDKPNIAQPPPGWERLLRIRGEGSTRFADVYYSTPTGRKLRSMVEIRKFLLEHPEYIRQGVTMNQFSFQIPRPMQENYVRKRPRTDALLRAPGPTEDPYPLSWRGPDEPLEQLGPASSPSPYAEAPMLDSPPQRAKKQATRRSPASHLYSSQTEVKLEQPQVSGNSAFDL